jgi:hypothetical protein
VHSTRTRMTSPAAADDVDSDHQVVSPDLGDDMTDDSGDIRSLSGSAADSPLAHLQAASRASSVQSTSSGSLLSECKGDAEDISCSEETHHVTPPSSTPTPATPSSTPSSTPIVRVAPELVIPSRSKLVQQPSSQCTIDRTGRKFSKRPPTSSGESGGAAQRHARMACACHSNLACGLGRVAFHRRRHVLCSVCAVSHADANYWLLLASAGAIAEVTVGTGKRTVKSETVNGSFNVLLNYLHAHPGAKDACGYSVVVRHRRCGRQGD